MILRNFYLLLGNSGLNGLKDGGLGLGPVDVDGVNVAVTVLDDVTERKVEALK